MTSRDVHYLLIHSLYTHRGHRMARRIACMCNICFHSFVHRRSKGVVAYGFGYSRHALRTREYPKHTTPRPSKMRCRCFAKFATSRQTGYHQRPTDKSTAPPPTAKMSLVSGEKSNFQFILRLLNTNVRLPRNDWTARGGIRDAMEK